MHTNELDSLLTAGDPARALRPEERRLAANMAKRSAPRRWFVRPLAVTSVLALLLGGGGVAATATGFWSPWAQHDAFAAIMLELPSGATCELRLGNMQDAPNEVRKVAQEAFSDFEITDQEIMKGEAYFGIPGTDPFIDDDAYSRAARWAALQHLDQALQTRGLEFNYQFSGEGFCS